MEKYRFTSIKQPAGKFYLSKMLASKLIPISQSNVRTPYNSTGIQRLLSQKRIEDIAKFCEDESAMFPTPIIVSAKSNVISFYDDKGKSLENDFLSLENGFLLVDSEKIKKNNLYFSIVDGQHRLAGIEKYMENEGGNKEDFELSVLFVFDTENYEDAKIFTAINRHQKPVSKSLVYDLYGLSDDITVEKFAHEVVNNINSSPKSLMRRKVKMLGYKTDAEIVSQATLVEQIIPLVSKDVLEDNKLLIGGYSPEKNDELLLRDFLLTYQVETLSELLIKYLNSWIRSLNQNNLYQKTLKKTVGFILAFDVFKYLFKDNFSKLTDLGEDELVVVLQSRLLFEKLDINTIGSSRAGVKTALNTLTGKKT